MTFLDGLTPLAPAYALLLGALLVLALGPAIAVRFRYWLTVSASVVTLIAVALVDAGSHGGTGVTASFPNVAHLHVLIGWLDDPAVALRAGPVHPLVWALIFSLVGIAVGSREYAGRTLPAAQTMIFLLASAAYGVMCAGTYRTLAVMVILFDGLAALLWLWRGQPGRAMGRLLLGVLTSAAVMVGSLNIDFLQAEGLSANALFSLAAWMRLGLYPMLESEAGLASALPVRQAWLALNLAIGLYVVTMGVAPWVAWPAAVTTLLHGVTGWTEQRREKALYHAACTWAGGVLVASAFGAGAAGLAVASATILVSWLVLTLTPSRLGRPIWSQPSSIVRGVWGYLPPALATVSMISFPLAIGWHGRGALFEVSWASGGPALLALVVIAEGAAVSVLYRYWRDLVQSPNDARAGVWRKASATLVCLPLLVVLLAPHIVFPSAPAVPSFSVPGTGAWIGLLGSVLWGVFLGYGRRWLSLVGSAAQERLLRWLRLGWLMRRAEWMGQVLSGGLLRTRAVIEGEHYLAWAVLLTVFFVLLIVCAPSTIGG
jgi:hypothetical protein